MATIKISELPVIDHYSTNTNATLVIGVDLSTGTTGKSTLTTLGEGLYAYQPLKVGQNQILFSNTIGQFSGNSNNYIQINNQNINTNGSTDYVASASDSDNTNKYIDMGINGSTFGDPIYGAMKPYDGYLYTYGASNTSTSGNLVIGTASAYANIVYIVGGTVTANIVAKMSKTALEFSSGYALKFGDGTIQTTASNPAAYSTASYAQANTGTVLAQAAFNVANTAVQNTAIIQLNTVRLSGNLIANSAGQGIFVDKFTSNSATFTQNLVVLGNLNANTLLGNIFFSNVITTTTQSNSILWTTQAGSVQQQTAQLWYYGNTQSLILDTDIPGDRLSISKVLFFRGFNSTGATIPSNSFIRLTAGVTANQIPYIALADATNSANATVAGFVKVAIANGAFGFAYSQGIVEDFNTSNLGQNGEIIFLSTTPGVASNVAPLSGNSNTVVQLGKIILSDATQGKVFIQNQLRQAYGKPNGSLLYAFANNITSSNTLNINDSTGRLNVASTIYAANGINYKVSQYPSTQTAITINMMTDTWVKCNVGASLAITPTTFTPGSEVIVIATNPNSGGGAARTITHGGAALNSSVGATSFTLGATTTAFIKYYSLSNDLANTYVQVTYS